jgi:hypothetical protein
VFNKPTSVEASFPPTEEAKTKIHKKMFYFRRIKKVFPWPQKGQESKLRMIDRQGQEFEI